MAYDFIIDPNTPSDLSIPLELTEHSEIFTKIDLEKQSLLGRFVNYFQEGKIEEFELGAFINEIDYLLKVREDISEGVKKKLIKLKYLAQLAKQQKKPLRSLPE